MSAGTVIITGAGRGIGAATASLAAAEGYKVCINYRQRKKDADSLLQQLGTQGHEAIAVAADVGSADDVKRLFDTAEEKLGPLTALVNNAAVVEKQTAFSGLDEARLRRILDVNVIGAFLCTQEAVARMSVERGGRGGSIVNVSSVAARTGSPHEYIDYAMSKGALDTMSAGLARELAPLGIRVNTVRPGFIYTDMHADGGEPGRVNRLAEGIPLARGGGAEEVARAIVWLMSEEANYAVGAVLDVTGGV
ncbi:MAG: SDR family oxidoreductase [Woeseiaceae bacterium]|nr:SDR family oxidoreductase [Woeseiaceae bacterium]